MMQGTWIIMKNGLGCEIDRVFAKNQLELEEWVLELARPGNICDGDSISFLLDEGNYDA
jgi:hypothetical protein